MNSTDLGLLKKYHNEFPPLRSPELLHKINSDGVSIEVGPFSVHVKTGIRSVAEQISILYSDFPISLDPGFNDFYIRVEKPKFIRRWLRPQSLFFFDDLCPFKPLPLAHAYPFFEWGLNWCISKHSNQFLIVHAAVVEKDGHCLVMPSPPGSGKSTLCSALVSEGWRLFSDELALISSGTGFITPVPRPVSLKNESIDIIRKFAPNAVLGRETTDTAKGTIAHMKPPAGSVRRSSEVGMPAWIVFPKFRKGRTKQLNNRSKARTLIKLMQNTFNHSALGALGFETVADIVDRCDCYDFFYGDLGEAVNTINDLKPPEFASLDQNVPEIPRT